MKKVIRHEAHPMLTGAQQLLKRVAIFSQVSYAPGWF